MERIAHFQFYGSLNDFLSPERSGLDYTYSFQGSPSVKDAMEALGVPHPEVKLLLVNESQVGFDYLLQSGDLVKVYPTTCCPEKGNVVLEQPIRFVLDVHLGKLAKALRMLGFDTLYQNDYADKTIATLAAEENRAVLTRDVGLLKHKIIQRGYWLRSQHLQDQLKEVICHFNLRDQFNPISRCLVCNTSIKPVQKESVLHLLPPKTKQYFDEFYQCPQCSRVYWKGSHYERMDGFVKQLISA